MGFPYDSASRTILLQLKRFGYPRIVAFGYGAEGNRESVVAAEVARQLGVKWVFVPYRLSDWKVVAGTRHYWEYICYAHNGVSAPHIQDLPAIRQMVETSTLIAGDCVVIPGHTGDLVAGGHLRWEHGKIRDEQQLIQALLDKHYRLIKPELLTEYVGEPFTRDGLQDLLDQVCTKLRSQIHQYYFANQFVDPYSFLDFWNWRERQAKFIVNSVRVYDFHQLDFWLPLWDLDHIGFWQGVPLAWRVDRSLFRAYLDHLQREMGLVVPLEGDSWKKPMKRIVGRVGLTKVLRGIKHRLGSRRQSMQYYSHPFQWYGIWDETAFRELTLRTRGEANINTLVVLDVLRGMYKCEST